MIRNLLYNCFASKWSNEWRLNVERLCRYGDVFNGRKLVLLKTGPDVFPPDEVESAFQHLNPEFIRVPNDPELGEVAGFTDALARLESLNPDEVTFYAHTKGAKYKDHQEIFMRSIRRWRDRMYHECLADLDKTDALLQQYACCGCFQRPNHNLLGQSRWHFAGTFWWVNHARLFSRDDWREVDQTFYGVEAYLGYKFSIDDARCLYQSNHSHNLYATRGHFLCECGHDFEADMKASQQRVKVCKVCFKRKAQFVGLIEMVADQL